MIDLALAFYLVLVFPAMQLWYSLRKSDRPKRSRMQRYRNTLPEIALPLLAVLGSCWWTGHTAADLGLALPRSGAALWCLLIPLTGFPIMLIADKLSRRRMSAEKAAGMRELVRKDDAMPRTPAELKMFLVLTLFIAIGWELLYRGFLTMALAPYLGVWPAALTGALAYGLAHGYHGAGRLAGSVAASLLLSAAYVVTGNLWWLMLVHLGLPLLGAISCYQIHTQAPEGKAHAAS